MKVKNIRGDYKKRSLKLSESVFSDEIRFKLGKRRYSMSKDVVFVAVGDISTKKSTGKNVGRLALASMAGGAAGNKNLAASALFGTLAATINTSSNYVSVYVYLRTGKHFIGNIKEADLKAVALIAMIIPADEIVEQIDKFQTMERFLADAPRTIREVNGAIQVLKEKRSRQQRVAESGDDFSTRESASVNFKKINAQLKERYELQKKLLERIKQMENPELSQQGELKIFKSAKNIFTRLLQWAATLIAASVILALIAGIYSG